MKTAIFGQFFEFSIPTRNIQESLDFYRELGFSEIPVGDIRHYHYAVVTDGRISIGLHAGGIDEPALSFVKSDVASYLQLVSPRAEELFFSHLGDEDFHEIGIHTPEGLLLIMLEARTFSRSHLSELPAPVTGRSIEISLGCRNIDNAMRYWSDAGFLANDDTVDDRVMGTVELLAPGLRLGLRTGLPAGRMALRCTPGDLKQAHKTLDRLDIPGRQTGNCHRVTTPEGIYLDLVTFDN